MVPTRVVVSLGDLPGHEEADGETDDCGEKANEDGSDGQRLARVEGSAALRGGHGLLVVRNLVLLHHDVYVEQLVVDLLLRRLRWRRRRGPLPARCHFALTRRPLFRRGRRSPLGRRLGAEGALEARGAGGVLPKEDVLDEGRSVEPLAVDEAVINAGVGLKIPCAIRVLQGDAARTRLHLDGVAAVEWERFHLESTLLFRQARPTYRPPWVTSSVLPRGWRGR